VDDKTLDNLISSLIRRKIIHKTSAGYSLTDEYYAEKYSDKLIEILSKSPLSYSEILNYVALPASKIACLISYLRKKGITIEKVWYRDNYRYMILNDEFIKNSKEKIIEALKNGPLFPEEIKSKYGVWGGVYKRIIKELKDEGLITIGKNSLISLAKKEEKSDTSTLPVGKKLILSTRKTIFEPPKKIHISKNMKSFVIPIISEFSGATIAFSQEMFAGAIEILENLKKNEVISSIIINGGILPSVPLYATKITESKLKYLLPGINNIEDAVVVVKPIVKLLRKSVGYETPLIYVFGDEDEENLKCLKDKLIAILKSPENIKLEIERVEALIKDTTTKLEGLLEERKTLLQELKKTKDDERRKYLVGRLKQLSRLINEYSIAIKTKNDDLARHRIQLEEHKIRKFINLYEWLSKEEAFVNREVDNEYNRMMREVFISGSWPILLKNSINHIQIGNLNFTIGHNLSSIKSSIPQKGAFKKAVLLYDRELIYNLAPEADVVLFSHAPSTKFSWEPKKFRSDDNVLFLQTGGFYDPEVIKECRDRKMKIPYTDLLEKGLDSSLTLLRYRDGIIELEIIGSDELKKLGRKRIESEMKRLDYDNLEKEVMSTKIDRGPNVAENVVLKMQIIENVFPFSINYRDLGRYIRYRILTDLNKDMQESVLISEADPLVDKYLSKLSKEERINLIRKYLEIPPIPERKIREIKFDLISDIHLGMANPLDEVSNYELLKAYIYVSKKDPPDVVINGGDSVGGGSKGAMKGEASQKNIVYQVIESLKKGNREKLEFSIPIYNIDTQFNQLIELERYLVEIIKNGGEVVLISGNHYNKSNPFGRLDEAERIFGDIIRIGNLNEDEWKRIHVFGGLDYGIGNSVVKGIPVFGIHKYKMTTDKTTGLAEYKIKQAKEAFLSVGGHFHSPGGQKEKGSISLALPSLAPDTEYPEKLQLPSSARGFFRVNLYVEDIMTHDKKIITKPVDKVVIRFYPSSYLKKVIKECNKEKL